MIEPQKLREASEWWLRLREDDRPDPGAEWLGWSQSDPLNLDAFDRVDSLASDLGRLSAKDRAELVNEFAPASLSLPAPGSTVRRLRRWPAALAAAVLLGLAAFFYFPGRSNETTYATERALHQELTLSDGSQVTVGASSVLSVHMRADQRHIRLREGEAYFQVKQDRSRPFVVDAGEISVTAVGTAFDVRRTGRNVAISVTEGRVRVARPSGATVEIKAGERVSYQPRSQRFDISMVAPERATAWREKRLEFVNEPLDMVIANVNRYASPRLRIVDPKVAELTFTGTVLTENLSAWIEALPRVLPVRVEHGSDEVRMESASKP